MMNNVIIDFPETIEDRIEDFRLEALDQGKNYTAAQIKLIRQPETEKPLLFYSQQLTRNFRQPNDQFGHQHIIKVFTPSNLEAAADTALEKKFNDTLLAFKPTIPDYSPLTDVHSQNMNLFLDEKTAQFLNDIGVYLDGFSDDFESIESVSATPYMEEIATDASHLKKELKELRTRLQLIKQEISKSFRESVNVFELNDEQFEEILAQHKVSEGFVQTYLSLKEKIKRLEAQLGEANKAIFEETRQKIRLPSTLEGKQNVFQPIRF